MADLPSPEFQRMFQRVAAQGDEFAKPPLEDLGEESYYGFLAKLDPSGEGGWNVFFELVNKQFIDNLGGLTVMVKGSSLPPLPGLAFHMRNVSKDDLLGALDLRGFNEPVEGSWYELQLSPGTGALSGELYDPEPEVG